MNAEHLLSELQKWIADDPKRKNYEVVLIDDFTNMQIDMCGVDIDDDEEEILLNGK
jgi:hypothetical protein